MDDPILPSDPPAAPAPAPAAPPAADHRLDRIEQAMAQLTETVNQAAIRLTAAPPPRAPVAPEDVLNQLAQDPAGTIRSLAQEAFRAEANQSLNPAVTQVLEMSSASLVAAEENRVDGEFGLGTYQELIKPAVDAHMQQLRTVNPRATADPVTVRALVDRACGEHFHALMDRRRTIEQAERRGGASHLVPRGGIPRLRSAAAMEELPPDVEAFLQTTEKHTGEATDRKRFAKLYHVGEDTGPGRHRTSVVDYLRAVGASPDTIKMYGGGGS